MEIFESFLKLCISHTLNKVSSNQKISIKLNHVMSLMLDVGYHQFTVNLKWANTWIGTKSPQNYSQEMDIVHIKTQFDFGFLLGFKKTFISNSQYGKKI